MIRSIIPAHDYKMIVKKKHTKKEENLQVQVCRYLKLMYPDVLFTSDISGMKLTVGQTVTASRMRSSDKFPDLMIFEPRGIFKGLFLELKRAGEKVMTKEGRPYAGHITEQWNTLQRLQAKGYYAKFAIGLTDAITQIDNYFR
jgi:hypothetical protein